MHRTLSNITVFAVGAVIGSAVTYRLVKKQYDKIIQEEIEDLKEYYAERNADCDSEYLPDEEQTENKPNLNTKPDIRKLVKQINADEGYTDYTNISDDKKELEDVSGPYIISPGEFAELEDEGYETVTLTFYADGVLTDESGDIIEDAGDIVGTSFSGHYGEYEDDTVFVRNEELMTDYEICRDERAYSEVFHIGPHLAEDE